jgi:hypothetical protein
VNQHTTIKETEFFVRAALRLYNKDLMQLDYEFNSVLELAVAVEN